MVNPQRYLWWLAACMVAVGLSSFTPAFAQSIQGRVLDDNRQPLPGVNVVIQALSRGVTTGTDGRFVLGNLPAQEHEVTFSFIGFRPETRTVDLSTGDAELSVVLESEALRLDEVTIESVAAERDLKLSTQSVGVLQAEELEAVRGQTLGETLEAIPGVTSMDTGPAISKPIVRGMRGQRVVIINDGITQEGQQWGDEHAPEIDPFAPAKIEVLKGAAGVEFGTGAIGGVIRVESRDLRHEPGLGGSVTLSGFSNNRQGAAAALLEGGSEWLPGFGWRLQGSLRRAGDVRAPDYVIGNSGFGQYDASAAVGYASERLHTEVYYSRFITDLGIYKGSHIGNLSDLERAIERGEPLVDYSFGYAIEAPNQHVRHDVVSTRARYHLPAGHRVEAQVGMQWNVRQEFDAHRRFGSDDALVRPSFDLRLLTYTADTRFMHRPFGNWVGTLGLSWMRQGNVNDGTGYLIPNFRAYTGGVFVRETWATDRWVVDMGVRFDYRWMRAHPRIGNDFERRFHRYSNVSGALGLIYQFATTWSIGLNTETAWRPPGVNELYSDGVHHGSARYEIGDPDLNTERSIGLDATLRHVGERVRFEMSAYNNLVQGFIYLFPSLKPTLTIRGAFPTFEYDQADAVIRGLDGALTVDATPFLELTVMASMVRGINRDIDQPLIYMPSDRLTLGAHVHLPDLGAFRNLYVEGQSRLVRRQNHVPENADYTAPPPGFALFIVGCGAELNLGAVPVRFSMRVENLLDTAYRDYLSRFRYFIDEPGRSIVFSVKVPFGRLVDT